MNEIGPWERLHDLDTWETDRWLADRAAAEARKALFESKHPGGTGPWELWEGPGSIPRTCSFCGGIHPEDAIGLKRLGWELSDTDKRYKLYMEPPGYHARFADRQKRLHSAKTVEEYEDALLDRGSRFWSPGPPVKVYLQHFNDQQLIDLFV